MTLVRKRRRAVQRIGAIFLALMCIAFDAFSRTAAGASGERDKSQYNLFNPTPENLLREMNALYENPYTVDAGHAQVETFLFQYSRDQYTAGTSDVLRETYRFGPMALKLGLLNNLDAELVLAPYTHVRYEKHATGAATTQEGFGDIIPRLKLNLWGNDGMRSAGAVIPSLSYQAARMILEMTA
jgi:hypothetical protein